MSRGERSGADSGDTSISRRDLEPEILSLDGSLDSLGGDQGTSGAVLRLLGVPPAAPPGDGSTGWRGGRVG